MQCYPQGGPLVQGLLDNVLGDTCALVRRPMFEALGGFTSNRAAWEDWEFFLRAIATGHRHTICATPTFYYTLDQGGRNETANNHDNLTSLLSCLDGMPVGAIADAARALVLEMIVRRTLS
jgi:hypothetical protein